MPKFNKVAIVGTGLIGGSIALDLKQAKLARCIVGVSAHAGSLKRALGIGAIDRGSLDLKIVKGADLLILAAPIEVIIRIAPAISALTGPECVVTDVASTKKEVTAVLGRLFPNYVGAHPLAGSEKRGIDNARPGIFKGSLCIITPLRKTSAPALKTVRSFWRQLGARTVLMDPAVHDKVLAFTSHLPHAGAFSLMQAVPARVLKFSASGLKDTTRLASSDARLWADIFLTNSRNITVAITQLERQLFGLKSMLRKRQRARLIRMLDTAGKKRNALTSI